MTMQNRRTRRTGAFGAVAPFGRVRRGMGSLLATVLLFFIAAFGVGLARHALSSRVRSSVRAVSAGSQALEIARSAIEEAANLMQQRMNTPGPDVLFTTFRNESGVRPMRATVDAPAVRAHLGADPLFAGFELPREGVSLELVSCRPLHPGSTECAGRFRFTVGVKHRPTGARREVSVERAFKVSLLSTPRPYDQFSLIVLHPDNLFGIDEVNARMRTAVAAMRSLRETARPRIVATLERVIALANGRLRQAGSVERDAGLSGGRAREYRREELVGPIEAAALTEAPAVGSDVTRPYHFIPSKLVLSTKAERIADLGTLNLVRTIRDRAAGRSEAAVEGYNQAAAELDAVVRRILELHDRSAGYRSEAQVRAGVAESDRLNMRLKAAVDRLRVRMEALSAASSDLLEIVRAYTDRHIESTDEAADWLRSFGRTLDSSEWLSRATFRFQGPGAGRRFKEFLASYNGKGQPLNGIVVVDEPGEPFKLENVKVHGKLVIVATGDVALRDVEIESVETDLLTVQSDGVLRAGGRVDAALVPRSQFRPSGDLRLNGALVFDAVESPELLAGSLTNPHVREPEHGRHFSGVTGRSCPSYFYASWSPWVSWTRVQRT
jgi:hypothetical protein